MNAAPFTKLTFYDICIVSSFDSQKLQGIVTLSGVSKSIEEEKKE